MGIRASPEPVDPGFLNCFLPGVTVETSDTVVFVTWIGHASIEGVHPSLVGRSINECLSFVSTIAIQELEIRLRFCS